MSPKTNQDQNISIHPIPNDPLHDQDVLSSPIDIPLLEQDQDIPVHPIPYDPLHDQYVHSNLVDTPLLEQGQDIPSIIPNDHIQIQEQGTFKEESNDLPPCQDQSILLNSCPQ